MNLTVLRVSLASLLLLAAGTALRPHMTSYVSTSALVNAPLISISSPFNGVIDTPSPRVSGLVLEGDTLFVLENSRSQSMELHALNAKLGGISGEIVGIEKQIKDLDLLSKDLIERRDAKIAARREWFIPQMEEARWDSVKAEAELARASDVHSRISSLSEKGNVREFDLIEAQAQMKIAQAELGRKQAILSRMEVELATLDGARGVNMSSSDFEQIEYRIDEISIRKADLDARLLGLQTSRSGLKIQIARASVESVRQQQFDPISTTTGLVWNASGMEGSPVSDGENVIEILACSRRFLEVVLPERHFEKVPAGTKAWVKLKGSSEPFSAEVIAAYGSGARPNRAMQAASPRLEVEDGIRVIVGRIGEADLSSPAVRRAFCDVGRAAEVRFEMDETIFSKSITAIANKLGISPVIRADDMRDSARESEG